MARLPISWQGSVRLEWRLATLTEQNRSQDRLNQICKELGKKSLGVIVLAHCLFLLRNLYRSEIYSLTVEKGFTMKCLNCLLYTSDAADE